MADKAAATSERTKRKMNPVEESLDPSPPPKKRYTKGLISKKKATEEKESHLEALSKRKMTGDSKVKAAPSSTVVSSVKPTEPEVIVGTDREASKKIQILGEGDHKAEAMHAPSTVPDSLSSGSEVTDDVKRELRNEIQKLGQGYKRIVQLLDEFQGPLEFRKEVVEYVLKEIRRFRTHDFMKHLERTLRKINKRINKDKEAASVKSSHESAQ
ncbi:sarcoma antigen 1-like [Thomomys bottae]